jgi:carboxypeptidase Q
MLFEHAMKPKIAFALLILMLATLVSAQEKVDLAVVNKIRTEALQNSQVMDHVFNLTEVYGPRLAASPAYMKAGEWAVKTLKGWGLEDAKLEKWGKFGRTWSYSRLAVHLLEPYQASLIAAPLAWSPGTEGPTAGEVAVARIATIEDAQEFKGKLKGKFVMLEAPRRLALHMEGDARRYTDADLARISLAPEPGAQPFGRMPSSEQAQRFRSPAEARQARAKVTQFLKDEGVLGVISAGILGDDGTIFTSPAGGRDADTPIPPVNIALAAEHYNQIARLVEKKVPVRIEVELKAQFYENADGANVVANLPGGKKKDELVVVGAHLDSWQAATGATDNAAGCAVMMEAVRILTALNLKMDRTVRIALWDAEEQGLIGSREYVTAHFADRETMALKPEHAKLSGYFNFDNGAGKIRGVYMQGNDMMRPIFEAWLEPFKDLGAATVTIRNTGGTDHLSFDAVGLPGFQFIQDPLDYSARTHHSNMDTYDRLPPGDLMQASAVVASFVYNAATRPEMLPRKPLPKPQPRRN